LLCCCKDVDARHKAGHDELHLNLRYSNNIKPTGIT